MTEKKYDLIHLISLLQAANFLKTWSEVLENKHIYRIKLPFFISLDIKQQLTNTKRDCENQTFFPSIFSTEELRFIESFIETVLLFALPKDFPFFLEGFLEAPVKFGTPDADMLEGIITKLIDLQKKAAPQ